MKELLHTFAKTGGLLALSGGATVIAAAMLMSEPVSPSLVILAVIVALIVFCTYHLNRRVELLEDSLSHPERTEMIRKNRILDIIAVLSFVLLLVFAYVASQRPLQTVSILLFPILIVLLYSVKWDEYNSKNRKPFKRLKEIPFFKNLITAITWGLIAFLASTYYGLPVTALTVCVFLIIIFRLLLNTITFDIRDIRVDKMFKVMTIPVMFGFEKTKKKLHTLNILFGVLIIAGVCLGHLPTFSIFLIVLTVYGAYYVSKATVGDDYFLYDVIVDGELLLLPIILAIGKLILGTV